MANKFTKKSSHISQDIFNYKRNKLCNLYDSSLNSPGQAYDIIFTNELTGWKEISFNMPFLIDKKRNYRWNYIKNEYLLRLKIDDYSDWFIIHSPKKTKNKKSISNAVSCSHLSSILKTKNLYLTFDDENGIGTLPYLAEQVLKATGWTLGDCDTFYERDGKTEKIRSLQSDGKAGAYQLITDICNLFNAYPIYDGEAKTVNIYSLNNKGQLFEMTMGKDIDSLAVEYSSDDIITRLYVEGEYGDDGYVGIDDVNPTHLSYLMNFDYYKSIGVFTDEHQAALDSYYSDMKETIQIIMNVATQISEKENNLNLLWGQINYVFYPISNGQITKKVIGGTVTSDQLEISSGNEITILQQDGQYRVVIAGENGSLSLLDTDISAIKFITKPSAKIGAKQVAIEAKEKLIQNLRNRITETTTDEKKADINAQITKLETEIDELFNGTSEEAGLYTLMNSAGSLVTELNTLAKEREKALTAQENIEADFSIAMGDMLKDGYWNNSNYAIGQEQLLFEDAVDMINQMSKPSVTYSVSRASLNGLLQRHAISLELNTPIRIYDPDLGINDFAYISRVTRHLDKPEDDTVDISNEDITLSGLTLDSILSRITKLADQIDQKNSLYDRAQAISKDGSIYIDRLNGQINVLKNQLSSSTSSWYTDENGNIVFESTNGKSAMTLCGEGFMIAYGRTDNGDWNWRTFGTGEGFTADAIITGYLSADRIEARSITVDKLESDVGATIDLSQNNTIKMVVQEQTKSIITKGDTPPKNPEKDALWLDTSDDIDVLKRWNGEQWIESTITQEEIGNIYSSITSQSSEISQMKDSISSKVSSEEYRTDLSNKADVDWVSQRLESLITQTATDIELSFNNSKSFTMEATGEFKDFIEEVRSYQKFSAEGQELGMTNSAFKTLLTNSKLSFTQNGVEIAYISNNRLHITEARVTEKLSIGTENNGYFDWITTATGLGLKWRG